MIPYFQNCTFTLYKYTTDTSESMPTMEYTKSAEDKRAFIETIGISPRAIPWGNFTFGNYHFVTTCMDLVIVENDKVSVTADKRSMAQYDGDYRIVRVEYFDRPTKRIEMEIEKVKSV